MDLMIGRFNLRLCQQMVKILCNAGLKSHVLHLLTTLGRNPGSTVFFQVYKADSP